MSRPDWSPTSHAPKLSTEIRRPGPPRVIRLYTPPRTKDAPKPAQEN